MKTLVTGTAGFIGYHLTRRLAVRGDQVVGLDNINDYYDVRVKQGRLRELGLAVPEAEAAGDERGHAGGHGDGHRGAPHDLVTSSTFPNLRFVRMDLEDKEGLRELFAAERFDRVVSLAAQAGVRYSLTHPDTYVSSNIQGFLDILEAVREHPVEHLVYASSSSVYGIDKLMPFGESGAADHPASLYAVSKRSNELMAHSYSHLYGIPTTGLRFFTVYGPWGRPDMALFLFTKAMLEGKPIDVFNYGEMQRDFTYVDDIVEGIVRVTDRVPQGDPAWDGRQSSVGPVPDACTSSDDREAVSRPVPARVYNIGNGAPVRLMDFIEAIESELGVKAEKNMLPIQPGDVPATWADCSALERDTGYRPSTDVRDGIRAFVKWYRGFYGV